MSYNNLPSKLTSVFNHTDQVYKYLWLLCLLDFVENEKNNFSFNEIVDKMIIKSWYMTLEYHLSLGHDSILKKLLMDAKDDSRLISTSEEKEIKNYLDVTTLKGLLKFKKDLTDNVPYRFLTPFYNVEKFVKENGKSKEATDKLILELNKIDDAFYRFSKFDGLNTTISISEDWLLYFKNNLSIVRSFAKYYMIEFLQDRNPLVPGLIYKIDKPFERKLEDVRDIWKIFIEGGEGIDNKYFTNNIYNGDQLSTNNISIDHFIPFQYTASDEFYNLTPISRELNSSKSNKLYYNFDKAFHKIYNQQFEIYKIIHSDKQKLVDKIRISIDKHLNNEEMQTLYSRENNTQEFFFNTLEKKLKLDYDNAVIQGFENTWDAEGNV